MEEKNNNHNIDLAAEIELLSNNIRKWESQCLEIEQRRKEEISRRLSAITGELVETAELHLSELHANMSSLEQELNDINSQISSLGTFAFGKKKELNSGKEEIEKNINQLTNKISEWQAKLTAYQKDDNSDITENRRMITDIVNIQNPLPDKPELPQKIIQELCKTVSSQLIFKEVYTPASLKARVTEFLPLSSENVSTLAEKLTEQRVLLSTWFFGEKHYCLSNGNTPETENEYITQEMLDDYSVAGEIICRLNDLDPHTLSDIKKALSRENISSEKLEKIITRLCDEKHVFTTMGNNVTYYFLARHMEGLNSALWLKPVRKNSVRKEKGEYKTLINSRNPTFYQIENEKIKHHLLMKMEKDKYYTAEQLMNEFLEDTAWKDISTDRLNAILTSLTEDNCLTRDIRKRKAYYSK